MQTETVSDLIGESACRILADMDRFIDGFPELIHKLEEKQSLLLNGFCEQRTRETEESIQHLRQKANNEINKLQVNPSILLLGGQVIQLKDESDHLSEECRQFDLDISELLVEFEAIQKSNSILENRIISAKKSLMKTEPVLIADSISCGESVVSVLGEPDFSVEPVSSVLNPLDILTVLKRESSRLTRKLRGSKHRDRQHRTETLKLKLLLNKLKIN